MGEYADMAIDAALNGYWNDADFEDDELGWCGPRRRRRRRQTNQQVFKRFAYTPKQEDF